MPLILESFLFFYYARRQCAFSTMNKTVLYRILFISLIYAEANRKRKQTSLMNKILMLCGDFSRNDCEQITLRSNYVFAFVDSWNGSLEIGMSIMYTLRSKGQLEGQFCLYYSTLIDIYRLLIYWRIKNDLLK